MELEAAGCTELRCCYSFSDVLLGFSFYYSGSCSSAIFVAGMVLGIFNRSFGLLSLTVNEAYFYISVSEEDVAAGYRSMLASSS